MSDYQKFMDEIRALGTDESLLERITPENFTYIQELYEGFKQEPNPSIPIQQASALEAITTWERLKSEEQASGYQYREPANTDETPTEKMPIEQIQEKLKKLRQQELSKKKTKILKLPL